MVPSDVVTVVVGRLHHGYECHGNFGLELVFFQDVITVQKTLF